MNRGASYQAAEAALRAAHEACFKAEGRDMLGMSSGPFGGVNTALEITARLERENERLRLLLQGAVGLLIENGVPVGVRFGKEFEPAHEPDRISPALRA